MILDFRQALHQGVDRKFDNIAEEGADYSYSTIEGSGAQDPVGESGDEDLVGESGYGAWLVDWLAMGILR
jgi:hypothetical protein